MCRGDGCYLRGHVTDRTDLRRLLLKVERASVNHTNLRTLLASAEAALTGLRRELRLARLRSARTPKATSVRKRA